MKLWKQKILSSFTSYEKLADFLELSPLMRKSLLENPKFPLKLPERLADKMQKKTLDDPILKQFLPFVSEEETAEGFVSDPVEDLTFQQRKKLLHKYEDRVLLLTTSACAMHCRFCFRQNFPYEKESGLEEELAYIESTPSVKEVVLSGGDPLSLDDKKLFLILDRLNQMPHLKRIRFHSRFPIGIPERIDDDFLSLLATSSKQLFFVLHINHPAEWDALIEEKMKALQRLRVILLSQTVLLKGVNDSLSTLRTLFETLTASGIIPYYLHRLDPVKGSHPFEVEEDEGRALIEGLRDQIAGYAVPRFVAEIPHRPSKTWL